MRYLDIKIENLEIDLYKYELLLLIVERSYFENSIFVICCCIKKMCMDNEEFEFFIIRSMRS